MNFTLQMVHLSLRFACTQRLPPPQSAQRVRRFECTQIEEARRELDGLLTAFISA